MTSVAENSLVEMINNSPLGPKLLNGFMIAISGILVVFTILIIIMAITSLLKFLFYKNNKPAAAKVELLKQDAAANESKVEEAVNADENVLIAVITAAIQASRDDGAKHITEHGFRVVSFKRANKAWKKSN
ncbi:MAG: hypothetical protein A2Y17_02735 [Clostridiales bacterium GWF2_38_85]|nr:MAG: hypothetical protein A2Y17_02735 [Clostridiales bacterium GWF2_38_85]